MDLPVNPNYERLKKAGICLQCGPETEKPAKRRGCCMTCYSRTMARIRAGEHSDDAAVKAKWLLAERKKGGRKSSSVDPIGEFLAKQKGDKALAEAIAAEKEYQKTGTLTGTTKKKK